MPGEAALKPAETPETPPKGRLEQALDLINDEAVETLQKGRNPRAYQRTEKLLAIARALGIECATTVEDFLENGCGDGAVKQTRGHYIGGAQDTTITLGANMLMDEGGYAQKSARGDMQREEKLAQLEALAARRRRDEADTRLTLVREFKELSELNVEGQPNEIREGIEARLAEITGKLRTTETTVKVEDPEPEPEANVEPEAEPEANVEPEAEPEAEQESA